MSDRLKEIMKDDKSIQILIISPINVIFLKCIMDVVVTFCHLGRPASVLSVKVDVFQSTTSSEMLLGGKTWHCFNETSTVKFCIVPSVCVCFECAQMHL